MIAAAGIVEFEDMGGHPVGKGRVARSGSLWRGQKRCCSPWCDERTYLAEFDGASASECCAERIQKVGFGTGGDPGR
ncbi:hypothetical protein D9M72_493410 [compost metagenome]